MCLITCAPKGVIKTKAALESFVESGMRTNTDGSGFAAKKEGLIILKKGFRNSISILDAIEELELGMDDELIIHHRTGTSGLKNDINMHPFLVTSNNKSLQTIDSNNAKLPAMVHNGVFGEFSDIKSDFSDTYHFVEYFMACKEIMKLMLFDTLKFEKIYKDILSWNKLAFIFPDIDMIRIGQFVEDSGYFHSNTGYKSYVKDYGGSSSNKRNRGKYYDGYDYGTEYEEYYNSYEGASCNTPKLIENTIKPNNTFIKENKDNIVSLYPTSANKLLDRKALRFSCNYNNLELTENNYYHFILVPQYHHTHQIEKDKAYTIESFENETLLNPVARIEPKSPIMYTNVKTMFLLSNIYIKSEYRTLYSGLFNAITYMSINPSKNKIKRVSKLIARNYEKSVSNDIIKSKLFGDISYNDLTNVYNKYKILKSNDDNFPIGEAIEEDDTVLSKFTLNDNFLDSLHILDEVIKN